MHGAGNREKKLESLEAILDVTLIEDILKLKKEKNAVILVHNYQSPEIQFVADFVGDTLSLALLAKDVDQDIIVFCGPDFMVETAAILGQNKIVVYANEKAKCPMAAMLTREQLQLEKEDYPNAKVVGYVNTTAECKCEMDICCTSSNIVKIIKSINTKEIILVPDKNLGLNVKKFLPDKEIILWPGYCIVHELICKEDIQKLAHDHPNAKIIVHPECRPEVVDLAHAMLSTDGMINYVTKSTCREFIVGTELDLTYRMAEENPEKRFYPVLKAYCRTQKKIKLENVLMALETLEPKVSLPKDVIEKARRPLERMLAFGRGD